MRISIELHDAFRRLRREGEPLAPLEVPEGSTVRDVLQQLGIDPAQPWNAALDGTLAGGSDRVRDGSRLIVFAPIAGG